MRRAHPEGSRVSVVDHAAWAARLERARIERAPIEPLTHELPQLSLVDAYAIQQLGVQARRNGGSTLVGHKIGLTSEVVQRQLGVEQPDYGALLDDMRLASGGELDRDLLIAPRVEAELAFVLGAPLGGSHVTPADVRAATSHVAAAIEIVDSRIAEWRISLADTVADNASSGAFVLGELLPYEGGALDDVETRLLRDGEPVEAGSTAAVLGDPCAAVAWLANALAPLGTTLDAGSILLSGAATRMVSAARGDRFTAELDGFGSVSIAFAGEGACAR
jgi:2-keto-4-pentenoate hydratase